MDSPSGAEEKAEEGIQEKVEPILPSCHLRRPNNRPLDGRLYACSIWNWGFIKLLFPPPLPYIRPDILESGGVRETAGVCYVRVYGRGEGHFGPAVCCSTVWVPIFLETSAWHVWAPCRSVHGTAASPRRLSSWGDTRLHLQERGSRTSSSCCKWWFRFLYSHLSHLYNKTVKLKKSSVSHQVHMIITHRWWRENWKQYIMLFLLIISLLLFIYLSINLSL